MSETGSGNQTSAWLWMINRRQDPPLRTAVVNGTIVKKFVCLRSLYHDGKPRSCPNCRICQRIDRLCIQQAQMWFFDYRHSAALSARKLNQTHAHSRISKLSAREFSLMAKPKPKTFSSRSMNPFFARGSPSKIYQNNSFPTSTSTTGKYSAIGEFRLAMTIW